MPSSATLSRTAWRAPARTLLVAVLLAFAACGGNDPATPEQAVFRPTTLLDAVLVGDRAAVERFVARGENVNATEADGTTPLMRAIHGRFPEIAKTLIDAGANVSATNRAA
jgi:ankyrin repeat protein